MMDLVAEFPILCRCWVAGILLLNLALYSQLLTPYDVLYSWDAVYQRGQYLRLLYGFLDIRLSSGEILTLVSAVTSLKRLEESIFDKRKLFLRVGGIMLMIIIFSIYVDLPQSLGGLFGFNLWYYVTKKSGNVMVLGNDLVISQLWIPLLLLMVSCVVSNWKLSQALTCIVPGHLIYYISEAINKTYGVDL